MTISVNTTSINSTVVACAVEWSSLSTPDRIAAIRAVWAVNLTMSQIAARIPGCNRNRVAGIYSRYKDQLLDRPLRTKQPGVGAKGSSRANGRVVTHHVWRKPRMAPMKPIPPAKYDDTSLKLAMDQLGGRQCRWPTHGPDEIGMILFCGHEAEGSYCTHHKRRSVSRGTESERTAVKVLARELLR